MPSEYSASRALPVASHCPYCAFQCGITVAGTAMQPEVEGDASFPVNSGALCVKGWSAAATLNHPQRLLGPLARDAAGNLAPIAWDAALGIIKEQVRRVQSEYGRDAVAVFGGGSLTNEKAYLLGKFARVCLRTANIDYNGRFCMSSAAAASIRAFGLDRGLPFPVADIAHTQVILLVGGNPAETMPPLLRYFEAQLAKGGKLIVADPRGSASTQQASLHLRLAPGTDAALANGLLHILIRDGLLDSNYIARRTEGFDAAKAEAAAYWPERVERITGVPEEQLRQAALLLASARSAMILTGRGPEQQSQGVNNTLAWINVALALGLPGKPFSGYGSLTGQGNGQGGREHGQKADQLPGYRRIDDPAARRHVASVWGVAPETLPGPGKSAYELLASLGQPGGARALLVFGSNPVVSAPNAGEITERLRSLDFLAVADFFLSETAELADVALPVAQWVEEEGTMTNLEGRVIRRRRVFAPPPGVRSDLDIICQLADRLGCASYFTYPNVEAVFAELRQASAGGPADYSGITYAKIDAQRGVFWPCPAEGHPGMPRLFADRFPTPSGKARFHAARCLSPAEPPDAEYPFFLTTGRVLAQYQSGTQTRRVAALQEISGEPWLEMHPSAAQSMSITEGDRVRVATRRGQAVFRARLTRSIRPDTLFAPFHWSGEQSANRLTNPALDPVSRMPEFKVCAARVELLEALIGAESISEETIHVA